MVRIVPCRLRDARRFVALHHRHLPAVVGGIFSIGCAVDDVLIGVVIVGRPTNRHLDNGMTLELTRCATDGTPNAASQLYAAAWRASKALGYTRLVTFTRADEPGTSLRAAGWHVVAERSARKGWSTQSRPRDNTRYETIPRTLWEQDVSAPPGSLSPFTHGGTNAD